MSNKITARAFELDSFAMRLKTKILNHKIETGCILGQDCELLVLMNGALIKVLDAEVLLRHVEDNSYASVLGGHMTRGEWESEIAWFTLP